MGNSTGNDSLKIGIAALAAGGSAVALPFIVDKLTEKSSSKNSLAVLPTNRSPKPGNRSAHSRSPQRGDDISDSHSSVGSTRSGDRRSRTPDVASFGHHRSLTPRSRDERSYYSDTASGSRKKEPNSTHQRRKSQRGSKSPALRTRIDFGDEQDDGFTSDEGDYVTSEASSDDEFSEDEDSTAFPAEIYEPLRGNRYIRIIKLYPGKGLDPLRCRLYQISLDNNPPLHFEAISYTWGEEYPRKQLLVHNTNQPSREPSVLTIRPNLYKALVEFRYSHKERWLWTDFVCINQEDKVEREKQVTYMAEVYNEASRTLIWLGNDFKDGLCLRFLARLADCSLGRYEVKRYIEDLCTDIFPDDGYLPFRSFFGSRDTWFSRRWVIQEVAKSVEPIVYCGSTEPVPWTEFVSGVSRLRLYSPGHFARAGIDVDILNKIDNMDVVWNETQKYGTKFNILHLLTEFHSSECERPRDRIYALMQLTHIKIEPSLSKKYEQIFKEFAAQCVSKERLGLDLLHCGPAYHHKDEDQDLIWPSWVPDWSQERLFVPLLDISLHGPGSELKSEFHLVTVNEISVRGRILKDFQIKLDYKTRPRLPEKVESVHSWIANVMPSVQDDTRERYFERFAHALVAGRTQDTVLASTHNFSKIRDAEEIRWKHVEAFFELLGYTDRAGEQSSKKIKYSPRARKYAELVKYTMEGRRIFQLEKGNNSYIAVGPSRVRRGDLIVMFDGDETPFVIRQFKNKELYRLIGDCYIVELMTGTAQEYPSRSIHLI